ncbi:otoferlin-like [Coccinella septempunctata]|uniref:otoferlin-like n=1 Tax=Coccinella septempunctata TaxID=41139 RepID=UPI001D06F1B9|nr:otoferlin-like [Coccinella septempunctata]
MKAEKIFDPNALRRSFLKTKKLCDNILCIFTQINDMWPDIFVSVWKESKELAYCRIPSKDVLDSQIEEEKGKMCGKVTTLYLQPEKKKIPRAKFFTNTVGKMEVLLWMGMEKSYMEILKNLPGGYEVADDLTSPHLHVSTNETHVFQCRCHLFQGRIRPGNDVTALSDTMIRIHFGDDCQESTIERETLNPVWNQTLIFKKVTQYGSASFIKKYPPSILIELLDRDKLFFWEFIGRTAVKPLVKMRDEPYGPPRFPPKLDWFKVFDKDSISAEILAAFEMLEITGDPEDHDEEAEKDIIRIPDDIKPELVSYRMEVYFWGLRHLKKTKVGRIKHPKMNIECLQAMMYSDSLEDTKNDSNFENPIKNMDLVSNDKVGPAEFS